MLTVPTATGLLGWSFRAANQAVVQLMEVCALFQISVDRRNRAFEAAELIEAFTALERQLSGPEGDNRVSEPARILRSASESAS